MSTPNIPCYVRYEGGNDAVDFSIPFPYFDRSYVKLILKSGDNPDVYLEENTDYTWKDDATITLTNSLSEGDILVIVRQTDLGSPAEFDNQRRLFPVAVMNNDDLSFQQIQELQEQLNRCYKEDITSGKNGSDLGSLIEGYIDEAEQLRDECRIDAQWAQDWAIKLDGTVDGLNYSSKYYALSILPYASDITTVASISSDVTSVAGISSDVTAIASDLTNIDAVASDLTNIDSVAGDLTNIDAIAADLTNIDAASGYADLAKDWAIKIDGMVDSTDYSSKYYANLSKQWATSNTIVESGKYGASYYALQAYNANVSAQNAKTEAKDWANKMDSAVSGGEYSAKYNASNSKVWAEGTDEEVQALGGIHSAKSWANSLGNIYKPAGSVAFASLPTLSSSYLGFVYNVTDSFTTTSDFVEGSGKAYPAGTNVVCIDTGSSVYKWDILGGFIDLSGYATAAQGAKADTAVQPADLTNYVTTNTDQDITGIKTYVGAKRIKFKQSSAGNKLGFTLYNNNNKEAASFEYITSAIDGYPLMYLGQYIGSNSVSYVTTPVYVGFRYYDYYSQAAYQLVAPLAKDAKTPFNLDIYHKTFYLPLGVTDGNTTVTTASTGLLDISSLLPIIPTVDQTYDGTSANAQSGVAVASAISTMLSTLYPVGSVYIGTQSTCPLATLISGSTWTLVSKGRVLQGVDTGQTAGSTVAAGLPNIQAQFNYTVFNTIPTGATYNDYNANGKVGNDAGTGYETIFDASRSNSIYGSSTTVQPPAYLVNIWERTA